MPVPCKLYFVNNVKREKLIKDLKDFKGIRALRLKLYLELSFRILKIILRLNFKFHFEPEATPPIKVKREIYHLDSFFCPRGGWEGLP